MKCTQCGAQIAPRNLHVTGTCQIVCGECYLRTADAEEIAAVLDAVEIETAAAASKPPLA
jgi:ribosome-binding protein aMBF1 (putative translation factor)